MAYIELNNRLPGITGLRKNRVDTAEPIRELTQILLRGDNTLFFEGHRWIDVRRYNLLNTLPLDRPADNVWGLFPLPVSEQ